MLNYHLATEMFALPCAFHNWYKYCVRELNWQRSKEWRSIIRILSVDQIILCLKSSCLQAIFFVSLPDLDQHCLVCGASKRGFSARSEPCFDWLAKPESAFQHVPVCRPSIWSYSERCYDGLAGHGSSQTGSARPEARTAADKYWGTIAALHQKSTPAKSVFLTPAIGRGLMFARGEEIWYFPIFYFPTLSLLLFSQPGLSHPFIELGAGGRSFIPNQPKRTQALPRCISWSAPLYYELYKEQLYIYSTSIAP